MTIDGVQIPLALVKTADFRSVYQALGETKRKIPARILRYCKEQLYDLVASTEPEERLCVVDIDEIDRSDDVEFLVGVGVAHRDLQKEPRAISNVGYLTLDADDLFRDLLHESGGYDPRAILEHIIPRAGKNTKNVPVFRYLRALDISDPDAYKASDLSLDRWVIHELKDFQVKSYLPGFFKRRHLSMAELIKATTIQNAAGYIPCFPKDKIDCALLKRFLLDNEAQLYAKGPCQSNFRKLATLYDKLKWGW